MVCRKGGPETTASVDQAITRGDSSGMALPHCVAPVHRQQFQIESRVVRFLALLAAVSLGRRRPRRDLEPDAGADASITALFEVTFSQRGLVLDAIDWTGPYPDSGAGVALNGGTNFSLPLALTPDVFDDGSATDIELGNDLADSTAEFTSGRLVTLTLTLPGDYVGGSPIDVAVEPGVFLDAQSPGAIDTNAGDPLSIAVVPEPGSALLLAGALGLACGRRCSMRRRTPL